MSIEPAGYKLVNLASNELDRPHYNGPAVAQFIFNYPMTPELVDQILSRNAAGQPSVVVMDDPLAFFDANINQLIIPVLRAAARVYTSTDNMIPIYNSLGIDAKVVVGLANPQFNIPEPIDESAMRYDWGYIGGLYPQRFRFFWQLQRLLPDLDSYIVTHGLNAKAVVERIRETRVNIAYGNFSDITDFKSNGTTFRAWEFPYAGAFILHDYRSLLFHYFKEDESIVTFRTVEECADLIRYYIAWPAERRRIANNARSIIEKFPMEKFIPKVFREIITGD